MIATYFWKEGQVLILPHQVWAESVTKDIANYLCVDAFRDQPSQRYGKFIAESTDPLYGWRHVPLDQFPKEFRTALLLLGVS